MALRHLECPRQITISIHYLSTSISFRKDRFRSNQWILLKIDIEDVFTVLTVYIIE